MPDCLIPPWVLPESPETIRWVDDASVVFPPAFGRGFTQRSSWADPRWGLHRRYRGLRSDQLAAIRICFNETRGQFNRFLVTPHAPLRGSSIATELLSNNTFGSGTTGWVGWNSVSTIAVADRVMRSTLSQNSSVGINNQSAVSLSQGIPYVARAFVKQGRGDLGSAVIAGTTAGSSTGGNADSSTTSYGMRTAAFVPSAAASYFIYGGSIGSGGIAGDYVDIPYMSLAQCALVDIGPNSLLNSNTLGSTWTQIQESVNSNNNTAPDGVVNADAVTETTNNAVHELTQDVTVTSAAADYSLGVAVTPGLRGWCQIMLLETTGSSVVSAYFNLTTGAVGTTATGANWANLRTFAVNLGNNWWAFWIVARKTNAATTIRARLINATANGTNTYAGSSASPALAWWRPTLAQSGVPTRLIETTGSSSTGVAPTGGAINVKGLTASTNGLLEIGDWFEVAGQLKQATARLNSDAAGLGYLQFRPALGDSPADNDPVMVNQPFGRFLYAGTQKELQNLFGLYGDVEMDLEEIYA